MLIAIQTIQYRGLIVSCLSSVDRKVAIENNISKVAELYAHYIYKYYIFQRSVH